MMDTISRQDALAAIKAESVSGETNTESDFAYNVAIKDALAAINALPAAPDRAAVITECAKVAEHLNGWGGQPCPELANHIAKTIRALAG